MKNSSETALKSIVHPETGVDIVSSGIMRGVDDDGTTITVTLGFLKKRDPFAGSIKRQVHEAVARSAPGRGVEVVVVDTPDAPYGAASSPAPAPSGAGDIARVVAIASGKGGVGKSTVTANIAVTLKNMGFRVGVLDADIYGPSMPRMFGREGYKPEAVARDGGEFIIPADADGIEVLSMGFFISPDDALVWRGPMAGGALHQLLHQTLWGELDYLLIDLPPGTGDVHISILGEIKVDGAIIVSTPQQVALADVRRGIRMFRSKGIEVPVLGIVENMAWFSPAELPGSRYYIFGRGGAAVLARGEGIDMLGGIPIVQSVMDGGESGVPAVATDPEVREHYLRIAEKIVEKLSK